MYSLFFLSSSYIIITTQNIHFVVARSTRNSHRITTRKISSTARTRERERHERRRREKVPASDKNESRTAASQVMLKTSGTDQAGSDHATGLGEDVFERVALLLFLPFFSILRFFFTWRRRPTRVTFLIRPTNDFSYEDTAIHVPPEVQKRNSQKSCYYLGDQQRRFLAKIRLIPVQDYYVKFYCKDQENSDGEELDYKLIYKMHINKIIYNFY